MSAKRASETNAELSLREPAQLVEDFFSAYSRGDWADLERLMTVDFRSHYEDHEDAVGRDVVVAGARAFRAQFPDLEFGIEHMAVSRDVVAAWTRLSFTHTSEYLGIPRTGRYVRAVSIDFFTLENGLLASRRHMKDKHGILRQLTA